MRNYMASASTLAVILAACALGGEVFAAETVKSAPSPEVVSFRSENLTLKGLLWKPEGKGPLPAVLYNHGGGRDDYEKQFAALGPLFASRGYVFLAPYRRGHGLSADQGEYIGDLLDRGLKEKGPEERGKLMVKLLETDHLDDQLAALSYLKSLPFVDRKRIAVAGNSFGGIQAVLMAERGAGVRAAVDFAGAALTWAPSPFMRERMLTAVRSAKVPIYFIQAENDHDLSPSRVLAAEMQRLGKPHKIKIFPPFGKTAEDGHSFGYYGGETWGPEVFAFLNEAMKDGPAAQH
jgi:dienelactone hydrolase